MGQAVVWDHHRYLADATVMEEQLVAEQLEERQRYHRWILVGIRRRGVGLGRRLVLHRGIVVMVLGIKTKGVLRRILDPKGVSRLISVLIHHLLCSSTLSTAYVRTLSFPGIFGFPQAKIISKGSQELS